MEPSAKDLLPQNRETIPIQGDVNNESTGFFYAPIKREEFDAVEFKKIRDVEVTELISSEENIELDLVPRPLYEEALEALAIAEETISVLNNTIAELEARVSTLENEIENLKEEIDNERLQRILAEENYDNARQEVASLTRESQLAFQRSVYEGIERTSLEAKYEGILAQNEALKDEIAAKQAEIDQQAKSLEGKEAQIDAGAKTNTEVTANILEKRKPESEDILFESRKVNSGTKDGEWKNGPTLEIYNFTSEQQTVKFDISGVKCDGGIWIKPIPDLNLAPNERKKVILVPNSRDILSSKPRNVTQKAQNYPGSLLIKSKTGTITFTTRMFKGKS